MANKKTASIRIQRLRITDYKGIDKLELDFPQPKMPGDPDVAVMGSRNGLGKTSVLECCALLLIGLSSPKDIFELDRRGYLPIDISEMIIRAGSSVARIEGELALGDMIIDLDIEICKPGTMKIRRRPEQRPDAQQFPARDETDIVEHFVSILGGMNPNPLLSDHFLYFHSYRKVQEGSPELGMMLERGNTRRVSRSPGHEVPISAFKLRILHSLMSRANLFEEWEDDQSENVLAKLNEFVKRYAGGTIQKLRPSIRKSDWSCPSERPPGRPESVREASSRSISPDWRSPFSPGRCISSMPLMIRRISTLRSLKTGESPSSDTIPAGRISPKRRS